MSQKKNIKEALTYVSDNVKGIKHILFTLFDVYDNKDTFLHMLFNRINKKIDSIQDKINSTNNELDRIKQHNDFEQYRYDVITSSGKIEIGLFARNKQQLVDIFNMSGEKIQIIRVIDEDGYIVEENEPHYISECSHENMYDTPIMMSEYKDEEYDIDYKNSQLDTKLEDDQKLEVLINSWKESLMQNKEDKKSKKKITRKHRKSQR